MTDDFSDYLTDIQGDERSPSCHCWYLYAFHSLDLDTQINSQESKLAALNTKKMTLQTQIDSVAADLDAKYQKRQKMEAVLKSAEAEYDEIINSSAELLISLKDKIDNIK